ncbi:MAG TPA: SIR2 family protein [Candidatus Wunengus sp. YC60]|uniref:SIR2 family protein n=1 Tax=Candidatus Wunengus sp. YC60 TaxID=3367697 RepID=UPI004027D1A2
MTDNTDSPMLESAYKSVQDCFASVPVIVLGSGHSCTFGIPSMTQLTVYIRSEVSKEVAPDDNQTWKTFEEKIQHLSLEAALHEIQLSSQLTDLIIRKTRDCIFPADREVLGHVIQNRDYLPLSRLYRHLFNSTHHRIQLITTNYDCIAEYAADAAGYAWATGFGYGYIGNRYGNYLLAISKGSTAFRMVDVWKVHGSLNWYRAPDGTTYYLPSVATPPTDYFSVIVTPGIDKYRRTHEEPFRTIIAGVDLAMDVGRSFLCIGYGFNDEHIQPKLLEKCKREEKIIVVLAKELTEAAKKVLLDGYCNRFVAFEQSGNGTRMFDPKHRTGVELPGINLWSLRDLLDRVL